MYLYTTVYTQLQYQFIDFIETIMFTCLKIQEASW